MRNCILFVTFVIILGLVGKVDYQEEIIEEQNYNYMVCNGFYPNYNNVELNCDNSKGTNTIRIR